SLQHLGRRDQQIKLRGFRIEIEDIEAALRKAPGVAAAAVALHTVSGSPRLTGYIVEAASGQTDQQAVAVPHIATHIAAQLPAYMAPSLGMPPGARPPPGNGKRDRKALPVPTADMVAAPARQPQAALKAVPQITVPAEPVTSTAPIQPAAMTP